MFDRKKKNAVSRKWNSRSIINALSAPVKRHFTISDIRNYQKSYKCKNESQWGIKLKCEV